MLLLCSLMFPPLERCNGNVQPVRHVTAVLWEREQSRAELISSSSCCCCCHCSESVLHRAKARHPALCFPAGVPTHLRTDIIHQDCFEYTRFVRDRRVTFREFEKCIRFISNKRRSLVVHGELWAYLTCCCSSL